MPIKAKKSHPSSWAFPRQAAVRLLAQVLGEKTNLDECLRHEFENLDPKGRAWLHEVAAGTLRWKGRLELAVDSLAVRKKPSGWLRRAMLVAAYQCIVSETTPPALVVSETVDLIRQKEGESPSKFANAILRKIAEQASEWRTLEFNPSWTDAQAAQWASVSKWLWKSWLKDHGLAWAKAYALASLERPKLWVHQKDSEWHASWTQKGRIEGSYEVTGEPEEGSLITQWPGFQEGRFFVQDISSQLLVSEISAMVRAASGAEKLSAIDLCAAPGGKSMGLSWSGFEVFSTDRDLERLPVLKQNIERVAPEIQIFARDDFSKTANELKPSLIWVDSPCTGSGILRRHPEIRWTRAEDELKELKDLQIELLQEAWAATPKSRFLAYSVCSVLKEEGELQIDRAGLNPFVQNSWFLSPQSPPFGDGFYGVLLRKPS